MYRGAPLMRTLGVIALLVSLVVGGCITWWASQSPTYIHRFKLIIEAEVDGVLRAGSSVIEVRTTDYKTGSAQTVGLRSQVFGEAVFVDLGKGRNVVALLAFNPHGTREAIDLLDYKVFWAANQKLEVADLPTLTGRARLPDEFIPTLVTFTDLNNPKSAREVGFTEFENVFGPDVHFKGAWIEMTRDLVTRGIEKRLPWIVQMKANGLGGRIDTHPGQFTVNVPYFTRG
jgi:hypothetical protein